MHTRAQIFIPFALRKNQLWANFQKGEQKMSRMTLACSRSNVSMVHATCYIHAGAQILMFVLFSPWSAFFELQPILRKVDRITPPLPWHVECQKYPHACHICPRGPKFRPFSLNDEPFSSYSPILKKKHTKLPQNGLDIFKPKGTHTHAAYTHEAQIFIRFTLRWAFFAETEIFEFPIEYNVNIKI